MERIVPERRRRAGPKLECVIILRDGAGVITGAGWGRVARASLPGSVEQVRWAVVETRAARWVRSNLRG
jgi:hypothetical protein